MEESLPTGRTKTSVSAWVDTVKVPIIKQGQLFEDERAYLIASEWGVDNLATKKSLTFLKYYTLLKPLGAPVQSLMKESERIIVETPPTPIESKLTAYSQSGRRKAVLVEVGSGSDAYDILQIWNQNSMEKTYDLKELGAHKAIYSAGAWGSTIVWNPEETKILYLAEKNIRKSEPFFTSDSRRKLDDPEPDDKENMARGHEYDFRQTWGEQLENSYNTIAVVLDIDTDGFRYFTLPNNDFACDLQWVGNNSFIGISLTDSVWRLGLIYCGNRESRIFQCDEHGHRYLSDSKRVALCPRVAPTQDYVIWQDRETFGPHESSRNILSRKIFPTSTDPRYEDNHPNVVFQSGRETQHGVPAVYDGFPKSCFSNDGNNVYFLTTYNARNYLLHIQRQADNLTISVSDKFPTDVQAILSVGNDFLLVSCNTSTRIPSLQLIDIKTGAFGKIELTESAPIHEPEPKVVIIPAELPPDELMPPSIYIEPVREGKIPLIVMPHGGPHWSHSNDFDHDIVYFTKLGFAVFKANYEGSLGTRFDTTDRLVGRISEPEVNQVHELVQQLLVDNPVIDSQHVFLCGGSHGGCIVTHLSSRFPGFYKAVVAWNPVIDWNAMMGTSDIADWVCVETGVSFDKEKLVIPTVEKNADSERLRTFSPVNLAHRVTCPTLLQLGTEDLRVPPSQGLIYYRALKSHGKDVELNVYDDNHPLSTPAVRANVKIHTAKFFNKVADKPIFID